MIIRGKLDFKTKGKTLEPVIKKALAVLTTGLGVPLFVLFGKKKRLYLLAANDEALLLQRLEGEVKNDGAFAFEGDTLAGLIKGRDDMSFSYDGSTLSFHLVAGKYNSTLQVFDISESRITALKERLETTGESFSLESTFVEQLRGLVSETLVKDVYQNRGILSFISVEKKRLTVFSQSGQHFAVATKKVSCPDFKIAIPAQHFNLIDQLSTGENLKFYIGHGAMHVQGEGLTLVLPFTQVKDDQFQLVPRYMEAIGKPLYSCAADLATIMSVCENLKTINSLNATFDITPDKKYLDFSFSTAKGKASDSIPISESVGKHPVIMVDPALFLDFISVGKRCKALTFHVYEKVVGLSADNCFIACSRKQ
jgi:hypothetical protein